ncbi:MAG TPA: signal peptidase I [Polyangiaceae bacterium]|jgi:signal peptidase I|nr:signal peptidase I [Polyangiaceae bacterium]
MRKLLRVLFWLAVIVGGLIGFLRATAIRWWQLPQNDPYFEASVAPTLRGGDWVVLWRATRPKFGDLALCPEPKTNRPVIARVAGEGGDHVSILGTALTVDRQPTQVEGVCDPFTTRDPSNGSVIEQTCSREVLGGRTHSRGNSSNSLPADAKPDEFDVPNGQFFLVSDNRALPWDSREFGPVDASLCAETVVFRLVSKDGFFDVANRLSLIH